MLTTDEIKALSLLIALALLGAGLAHLDARHPRVLTLTLGDSLVLGRATTEPEDESMTARATSPGEHAGEPGRASAGSARDARDATAATGPGDAPGGSIDVTGRMDVNRATATELEALPGVGPKMAERIVEERRLRGAFKRPRDLRRVKGIGEKTLARLLPYIRTESAADSAR